MENSMESPQKTEYRVAIWSSNPTPGYMSRQTIIQKDARAPVFIAALCTIAMTQNTKGPFTDEWIRIHVCVSIQRSTTHIEEEGNNASSNDMDGPRDYHSTKWSKSERQMPCDITYMWKHKIGHKIYETDSETENKLVVAKGEGGRGRDGLGAGDLQMQTVMGEGGGGFADADGYV